MAERERSGEPTIRVPMALALITGGPYALFVVFVGLRTMAMGSYPRALGVRFSTDERSTFPHGGQDFWIGVVVLVVGIALVGSLVLAARQVPGARWAVVAWLLLAVVFAATGARHPGEDRRCFHDGYSDRQICASSRSVVLRDATLWATPAGIAIVGLLLSPARRRRDELAAEPVPAEARATG